MLLSGGRDHGAGNVKGKSRQEFLQKQRARKEKTKEFIMSPPSGRRASITDMQNMDPEEQPQLKQVLQSKAIANKYNKRIDAFQELREERLKTMRKKKTQESVVKFAHQVESAREPSLEFLVDCINLDVYIEFREANNLVPLNLSLNGGDAFSANLIASLQELEFSILYSLPNKLTPLSLKNYFESFVAWYNNLLPISTKLLKVPALESYNALRLNLIGKVTRVCFSLEQQMSPLLADKRHEKVNTLACMMVVNVINTCGYDIEHNAAYLSIIKARLDKWYGSVENYGQILPLVQNTEPRLYLEASSTVLPALSI
jgi:hypothetical protein